MLCYAVSSDKNTQTILISPELLVRLIDKWVQLIIVCYFNFHHIVLDLIYSYIDVILFNNDDKSLCTMLIA